MQRGERDSDRLAAEVGKVHSYHGRRRLICPHALGTQTALRYYAATCQKARSPREFVVTSPPSPESPASVTVPAGREALHPQQPADTVQRRRHVQVQVRARAPGRRARAIYERHRHPFSLIPGFGMAPVASSAASVSSPCGSRAIRRAQTTGQASLPSRSTTLLSDSDRRTGCHVRPTRQDQPPIPPPPILRAGSVPTRRCLRHRCGRHSVPSPASWQSQVAVTPFVTGQRGADHHTDVVLSCNL